MISAGHIRPLVWCDLTMAGRTGAFWAATIGHALLLLLFVLIWGEGLPIANGGTNWQQFNTLDTAILTVLLPWTAARCIAVPRRDLVMLALATATSPSRLLLARWLALALMLFGLIAGALPVVFLMQQVAAMPVASIVTSVMVSVGLAIFAAAAANSCMVMTDNPLLGWTGATVLTLSANLLIPTGATVIWILVAATITTSLVLVADSKFRYLPEESAA